MIGQPLGVTLPQLTGVRTRYCNRWDEESAAVLARSLMRTGIADPSDWHGSAVDFVETTLKRFMGKYGSYRIESYFDGVISIMDTPSEMNDYERSQTGDQVANGERLYLVIDYGMTTVIPLKAVIEKLVKVGSAKLAYAFYYSFRRALNNWMFVYDLDVVEEHIEMWQNELDEEEMKDSLYGQALDQMPTVMTKGVRKYLSHVRSVPVITRARRRLGKNQLSSLLKLVLEASRLARKYDDVQFMDQEQRELFFRQYDCEHPLPGACLAFYPDDAIHGMLDEDNNNTMQSGQPLAPWGCFALDLTVADSALDKRVKQLFTTIKDMLRTLDKVVDMLEIIWEVHRGWESTHRVESALPAETGTAGLR